MTELKDGGGLVLSNARVVLIYWGTAGGSPQTNPSHDALTQAFGGILSSPWGSKLSQYRGASVSSIEAVDVNTSSDPAASFTDAEIFAMLETRIAGNQVPAPSKAIDRIYCAVMPIGHSSGDTNFVGQHQLSTLNGVQLAWAWVTNDGTLTGG